MRTAIAFCFAVSWMVAAARAQVGVPVIPDTDGDGVDDVLEAVLGTNPLAADTDGDGWIDGIELARRSDPLVAANIPHNASTQLSAGFVSRTARRANYVRSVSFVYLPNGYPASGLEMQIVVLQPDEHLVVLGASYLASPEARRTIDFVPVPGNSTALLMVVGATVPDSVIRAQGYMSAAVVVWHGAPSAPQANPRDRDATDAFWLQHAPGGPILLRRIELLPGAGGDSVLYHPIEPSSEPPPDYTPSSICRQGVTPVGYENGIVLTRVIQAACDDGWDAYCSPTDCAASLGDEYESLDPAVFVGG